MNLQTDVRDTSNRDPGMTPDAVIVLGMHRAGTSTLTCGLQALGVDLGDNLLGPDEDNPKGYWEDRSVHELNERISDALSLKWHNVGAIKPSAWQNPVLASLRTEAATLIRERFGHYALWGFKDPRVCRLLDFWQPVFQDLGIADGYAIVIRNPLSVAKSLWARNGFSEEKSYLLWLRHLIPAMCQTHGKPRVVVDFDELMQNPGIQLERIAKRLNISMTESIAHSVAQFSSDFVDNKLRHTHFTPDDLKSDQNAPRLLHEVYECLLQVAHDRVELDSAELICRSVAFQKELDGLNFISSYTDKLEARGCIPDRLVAQLYLDFGDGFNGEEPVTIGISSDTSELKFKLNGSKPMRIRFDPANTYLTLYFIEIFLISTDLSTYEIFECSSNGLYYKDKMIFNSEDPFLAWDVPEDMDVSECVVSIRYGLFGYEAVTHTFKEFNGLQMQLEGANLTLGRQLNNLRMQRDVAHDELARFLRSIAYRVILRRALTKFSLRSPMRAIRYIKAAQLIIGSNLFDYSFYISQNPDVASSGIHPLVHFLDCGATEGRDPHPLFDTSYYMKAKPGTDQPGMNALVHYLKSGALELRDPHPLFRTSFYLEKNPNVSSSGLNPLVHFTRNGALEGSSPHPWFDTSFYLESNPDVVQTGINPLVHFVEYGALERRAPHPCFNTTFYLENNPDVAQTGINPLVHFVEYGASEGRAPNPESDRSARMGRIRILSIPN